MKRILLTLAVFTFAITALHAQVPDPVIVDPAVQAAVEAAVPAKYASYTGLALIALMWLGRGVPVLQKGSGLVGWFKAILFGTNIPHIILACLALLTLSSCQTTAGNQRLGALVGLAVTAAEARGVISPQDAADIRAAESIVLPPTTAIATTSGK